MERSSIDCIFWDAAQITSEAERSAFLDQACAGDDQLRQRVEQLQRRRRAHRRRVVLGRHRQVVHLGIGGDLARLGEAADLDHVELHHLDGARIDQPGELALAGLGLEAGDRNPRMPRQSGAAFDILGLRRLLEPADVERQHRLGIPHRHPGRQRGIGIDHQIEVGTERFACRRDPRDVIGEAEPPDDYKFWMFDGTARFIQVDKARFREHTRQFYTPAWNRLDIRLNYAESPGNAAAPPHLGEMLEAAGILAEGFRFVRVDLYDTKKGPLFGELTFAPEAGLCRFWPPKFDLELGESWSYPRWANEDERLKSLADAFRFTRNDQ